MSRKVRQTELQSLHGQDPTVGQPPLNRPVVSLGEIYGHRIGNVLDDHIEETGRPLKVIKGILTHEGRSRVLEGLPGPFREIHAAEADDLFIQIHHHHFLHHLVT